MHLHIVFVLLYSLCVSLYQCSFVCVDVIRFFTYVLRVAIWRTLKDVVRLGERKRDTNGLSQIPSKEKKRIK